MQEAQESQPKTVRALIETSQGRVNGAVTSGLAGTDIFMPDDWSILERLFRICDDAYQGLRVDNGWVVIELSDTHYGYPEYKLLDMT